MTPVPAWFRAALASTPDASRAEVAGTVVRARCWGRPGPGVVLVHGGAAHAGWWDHIGPRLAEDRRVVAVDLSGHGDSGRRPDYPLEVWADEVVAQATAGGIVGPFAVIGHSLGGYVALAAGRAHPDRVAGVTVIDAPVPARPASETLGAGRRPGVAPARCYPTREAALARFRFVPDDPYVLPYLRAHVAAGSVVERPDGWTWKFDPVAQRPDRQIPTDLVTALQVRLGVLRAEHGLFTDAREAEMRRLYGRPLPVVPLPGTGHHALLDDPLAVVAGLRGLASVRLPS